LTHAESRILREAIAVQLGKGRTVAQTARRYGVPVRYVRNVCSEHGLAGSPRVRAIAIVARLLRPGGSLQQIADELGVHRSRVHQVASEGRRLGIVWGERGRGNSRDMA
jgi:hypothetical protein